MGELCWSNLGFYVGSSNSPFLVFVTQKVPEYSAPVKKNISVKTSPLLYPLADPQEEHKNLFIS